MVEQEHVVSECQHHWVIESPNGPVSIGVCKLCKQRSEFRNSMPGSGWDRGGGHARRARQAKSEES